MYLDNRVSLACCDEYGAASIGVHWLFSSSEGQGQERTVIKPIPKIVEAILN